MDFVGVEVAAVFAQVLCHLGLHEVLGGWVWGVLDALLELPRHAVPYNDAAGPKSNTFCLKLVKFFLHKKILT